MIFISTELFITNKNRITIREQNFDFRLSAVCYWILYVLEFSHNSEILDLRCFICFRNVLEEVKYQVRRLYSHPSIALFCGNDEGELALMENKYFKTLVHSYNFLAPELSNWSIKIYWQLFLGTIKQILKLQNRIICNYLSKLSKKNSTR